ncbi:Predicted EndoIII-related endonuclease [Methanopyrus kandleri AV19]|uniref:thymine-DNA glycosylase n=1 Tax=Methanopyrus kandleri (strain AV19 / DSM 6324 / JCM 9639 / NBRC 100938) TaxID=190192 RepID=Q8TYU8_METKA|nr:Predicted EndoIII-related endonuclease [Methanopyrus kandleri AV19]
MFPSVPSLRISPGVGPGRRVNPVMEIVKHYEDHPIMKKLKVRRDPFRALIQAIISQRTRDDVTDRVAERFLRKFKTPKDVAEVNLKDLVETLRDAGLYRQKAKMIKECCERILADGLDLEEIVQKPTEEARRELMRLPGVGPKTADVVLLFAGGHDVCPVDTHVARVSRRLGLTDSKEYFEVQEAVHEMVPEGERGKAHLALIQFGREICRPRKPQCELCFVRRFCPYGGEQA